MLTLRAAHHRGQADFGWLKANHSFSFGHYYDPNFMGFSDLLVINDDTIAAATGFDTHGHRDMEIITYVLSGSLAHRDSLGHESILRYGDVQYMNAGTGIRHSEYNASPSESLRLLQIWIQPSEKGLTPSYQERHISTAEKCNVLRKIAGPGQTPDSLSLHQDAELYASILTEDQRMSIPLETDRVYYLQVASGKMTVNTLTVHEGDGVFIRDEAVLDVATSTNEACEYLLFNLRKDE